MDRAFRSYRRISVGRTVEYVDELTQVLHHIKNKIEHQIDTLARFPGADSNGTEESVSEQIKYRKMLNSQLSDVEKAIELSLAAIRLRNVIGRGD